MVRSRSSSTSEAAKNRPLSALLAPGAVVLYLALTAVPGLRHGTRLALVEGALTVIPFLGGGVLLIVAIRRWSLPLGLLGGASVSWAIGNTIWNIYGITVGDLVPFPSLADPFYLLFLPLAAWAVLALISDSTRTAGRLRMICDSLISGLALFAAAWPLVLRPAIGESPDLLGRLVSCAYPVGDVALLALVVPAIGRMPVAWRPVLVRLALAFAGFTASDVSFAMLSSTGSWTTTHPASVGWVLTFCVLAALVRAWPSDEPPDHPRETADAGGRSVGSALLLLSYLPVLTGSAVTLGYLLVGRVDAVSGVSMLAVVGLGTLRQQLAFWENDSLTRGLEDRVAQRTAQLADLAYTDPLTGLANRTRFGATLSELTASGIRPTVVLLDLDGFKAVNDTLGHAAGDELLRRVAGRLRRASPGARLLARLGGDEFAIVLLPDTEPDAARMAEAILEQLSAPFLLTATDKQEVRIGASIGIAGLPLLEPQDADRPKDSGETTQDSNDVLRDADIAMYAAKAAGRNRWLPFDPLMRRATEDRKSLEDDLHAAVADEQLTLNYQPVVQLASGAILGVEALLRWNHPTRGEVPPDQFIPIAEETGLIGPIGEWVLKEACRQVAEWKRSLPLDRTFVCSVNLSARQVRPGLLDAVTSALESSGLAPNALALEVTESVLLDDDCSDPELLQHVRRLGTKIYLDDFGTGYSSLSYLRRFPVDGLKIDRAFVAMLADGDEVLASAIIGLAGSLQLGVVAEGIELPVQRAALQSLGCRLGQGFGLYRPMPAEAVTALLHSDTVPVPAPRVGDEAPAAVVVPD